MLYRQPEQIQRALLLGVGGGAVILQLQQLLAIRQFTAIEIDEHHLTIAQDWFGIDNTKVNLVHDDAVKWLLNYSGEPFDLIIDDLFGHSSGEPVRACALEAAWLDTLRRNLSPAGLLVANCVDAGELSAAVPAMNDTGFRFGYRWSLPSYENIIAVLSCASLQARDWSKNLEHSGLGAAAQRQARSIKRQPIRGLGKRV